MLPWKVCPKSEKLHVCNNSDGWQLQSCNDQVSGSFSIDNLKTKPKKAEWLEDKGSYDHNLIENKLLSVLPPKFDISFHLDQHIHVVHDPWSGRSPQIKEFWWSIISSYNSTEFAATGPFSNQPARKFFWQLLHLHRCNRWCWNQVRCSLDVEEQRIWLGLFKITCYSLGEVIRFTIRIPSQQFTTCWVRCICQPTHGTSQKKSQDAPLHFHLPLLPFQPPTSKDERLNHQVSS